RVLFRSELTRAVVDRGLRRAEPGVFRWPWMKIVGAIAELLQRLRRYDHRGRKADQPGSCKHLRRNRGELIRRGGLEHAQPWRNLQQALSQNRTFDRSSEQNDRVHVRSRP